VGRLDGILADIRKYGFSLVTLLLTASALITTANPVTDRVASSSVVIVLVVVLFAMDRYWWVLLRQAVHRAGQLETLMGMHLSRRLDDIAKRSHNTLAASLVYEAFVALAFAIALVAITPYGLTLGLVLLIVIALVAALAILGMHILFQLLLPPQHRKPAHRLDWASEPKK
jgi:hypothetical protein